MHSRRPPSSATPPLPLAAALITWLPIAGGIVLGTLLRGAVIVFGEKEPGATAASILFASLGALLAARWFYGSTGRGDGSGAWKLSLLWLGLSICFRALWLGVLVGGGWSGVLADYRIWDGQPGVLIALSVALAPLLLKRPAHQEADEDHA